MKLEQDDVTFRGICTFLNIPIIPTDTLKNTAIPNVNGRQIWKSSGHVVTITNFLGGVDGQQISIVGDGTTTVSNNTNIITNTSANILLALNLVYRFTYLNSTHKWYMDK